ncbi:MAG: hypothetical protein ABIM98_03145 [candidate division WOR-3 bacterium]
MLIFLFSFYLSVHEVDFFSGCPLSLFNPLFLPYIYIDSINDFSPNFSYKNFNYEFIEPDSEGIMTRFLLYRTILNTEQNSISSFLPFFNGKIKSLLYFSLFKNRENYNFSKHNYYFLLKSKSIPLYFKLSNFDANPFQKEYSLKNYSISLKLLFFYILFSEEKGFIKKNKYSIKFYNLFKNLYYTFEFSNYNFYLENKRNFKNFKVNLSLPFAFTNIEQGKESKEGERYIVDTGLNIKFLKFSYFIQKLIFPLPFDSLRETLNYKSPIRKRGFKISLNYKNKITGLNLELEYFNTKDLFITLPFTIKPLLYSGNFLSIFTCDSIELFDKIRIFLKYKNLKSSSFNHKLYSFSLKLFFLKNLEKNYLIYLKGSFNSFDKNYLFNLSLEGNFYSYFMLSFSYNQPMGGNFFYPQNYSPFPFYSIKIFVNVSD